MFGMYSIIMLRAGNDKLTCTCIGVAGRVR